MGGEKSVLTHCRRSQREFGNLAGDQIEIGRLLGVVGENLKESGVVDAVVVIMATVDID